MARIRTIKPDFWVDEKVVQLTHLARLLFIGLWNFADDEGRMQFSPLKIKMQIFPADDVAIQDLFGELTRQGFIQIYPVGNVEYLQIVNFARHQKIDSRRRNGDKRTASKFPAPLVS